jgi:hypothetical protein
MSPAPAAMRCSKCRRVSRSWEDSGVEISSSEGASLLIEGRQQAARLHRQGHGDGAPVVGVGPAFGQAAAFQIIDHGHHRVAVNAQPRRQLALGLSVVRGERHQHRVGPRIRPDGRQPVLEVVADIRTQLCEQKRNPLIEFGDPGRLVTHGPRLTLDMIITMQDDPLT